MGKSELVSETDSFTSWTLINEEFDLFLENYDYSELYIERIIAFHSNTNVFNEIIDELYALKMKYTEEKNEGKRLIVKVCLNAFIGLFGIKRSQPKKEAYMENGKLRYRKKGADVCGGRYLPISVFASSYARVHIIRSAQKFGKRFIYTDTDSIHFIDNGEKIPVGIEIDQTKLGAFKTESFAQSSKYLKPKTYCSLINGQIKVVCSGLDISARDQIKSMDDFAPGKVLKTKRLSIVNGKEVCEEGIYTIGE